MRVILISYNWNKHMKTEHFFNNLRKRLKPFYSGQLNHMLTINTNSKVGILFLNPIQLGQNQIISFMQNSFHNSVSSMIKCCIYKINDLIIFV